MSSRIQVPFYSSYLIVGDGCHSQTSPPLTTVSMAGEHLPYLYLFFKLKSVKKNRLSSKKIILLKLLQQGGCSLMKKFSKKMKGA